MTLWSPEAQHLGAPTEVQNDTDRQAGIGNEYYASITKLSG